MGDDFFFKWRLIEVWNQPEGVAHHSRARNIFSWKAMTSITPSTELGRYVEEILSRGFNGLVLYGPQDIALIDERPNEHRIFSRFLTDRGIGLFIRRSWSEGEGTREESGQSVYGQTRWSQKLCPYSSETRAYWTHRIKQDFKIIPDLAGYRLEGSEILPFGGAPWMCNCEQCGSSTPRERVRDAIQLVAKLIEPFGGTIVWMNCEDDPWGQRYETHYLCDMTSEIPENSFVATKQNYWDFHPEWPRHPLYDLITKDSDGNSPYISAIQEPGEYQGGHDFPWCNVDEWSGVFKDMANAGMQGILVVAQVHHDGWDHPLNMVNWAAITQYMHNPNADPEQIKFSWAREEFGLDVASTVVKVLDNVTEAARGAFEFDALWTACHSLLPNLLYLDSHMCGPYRQVTRTTGMMGLGLPLDMYIPERANEIRAKRNIRMVFNRVAITPELKDQAMLQKQGAVKAMQTVVDLWNGLHGKIDVETHEKVLVGLQGNRDDTIIFGHVMELYMDWKLGTLTEAKIDAVLSACIGLRGVIVPDPLTLEPEEATPNRDPVSLKTFAEELRRELHEPWVEAYWEENPRGIF